jgi:hypothetical protein
LARKRLTSGSGDHENTTTPNNSTERDNEPLLLCSSEEEADAALSIAFGSILENQDEIDALKSAVVDVEAPSDESDDDASDDTESRDNITESALTPNDRSELDDEPLLFCSTKEEANAAVAIAFGSISEDRDEIDAVERTWADVEVPSDESDDDASEDTVRHNNITQSPLVFTARLMASLGATIISILNSPIFEEDDVVAAATIAKTAGGVGGGAGAAKTAAG